MCFSGLFVTSAFANDDVFEFNIGQCAVSLKEGSFWRAIMLREAGDDISPVDCLQHLLQWMKVVERQKMIAT